MSPKNLYSQKIKPAFRNVVSEIKHPGNNPHYTSLSIAVGIFIGIAIPMGLQVWTMALLLIVLRFNMIIASFVSLISNPFTVLPIYYGLISFGEWVLGMPFPWELLHTFLDDPGFTKLLAFGGQGMAIFFTGSVLLGLLASTPVYFLSLSTIKTMRRKKEVA